MRSRRLPRSRCARLSRPLIFSPISPSVLARSFTTTSKRKEVPMKLDGKVALITGAASGIGHAIAKRFLEADGRVVIADLKADGAKASAKELAGEKSAIGVGMDVSKEDQVNAGVEETVKTFGRVDILVSNAGIQIVYPIEEFPFADWKKLLAIHLDGAFLTTKACIKHMYDAQIADLITSLKELWAACPVGK